MLRSHKNALASVVRRPNERTSSFNAHKLKFFTSCSHSGWCFSVCVDWCVDCKCCVCVCVLWLNRWPRIVTLPRSRKQLTENGRVDNHCPVNVNWDVCLIRRSLVLNEALAIHGTYANIQVNLPPLVCVIVNQGLLGPPWTKRGGQADSVSNLTNDFTELITQHPGNVSSVVPRYGGLMGIVVWTWSLETYF